MSRTALATLAMLVPILALGTAQAWQGELAGAVQPISEVLDKAESGDYVAVEGEVVRIHSSMGSLMILGFEDDTGTVLLAIPNHLRRHFDGGGPTGGAGPSGAKPRVGMRARVAGKWGHARLDTNTWGIRVQHVELLGS